MELRDGIEPSLHPYQGRVLPLDERSKTWSGRRDSDPYTQLGRMRCCHYTTPAQKIGCAGGIRTRVVLSVLAYETSDIGHLVNRATENLSVPYQDFLTVKDHPRTRVLCLFELGTSPWTRTMITRLSSMRPAVGRARYRKLLFQIRWHVAFRLVLAVALTPRTSSVVST